MSNDLTKPETDARQTYIDLRLKRFRKIRRVELLLRLYSWLGVFVALFGAVVFTALRFPVELSREEVIAVTIVCAGLAMSILSLAAMSLQRYVARAALEQARENAARTALVEAWADFEQAAKAAVLSHDLSANTMSLRPLLDKLQIEKKISMLDAMGLRRALELRNSVVHSAEVFSEDDIREAISKLGSITRKLG